MKEKMNSYITMGVVKNSNELFSKSTCIAGNPHWTSKCRGLQNGGMLIIL